MFRSTVLILFFFFAVKLLLALNHAAQLVSNHSSTPND